MKFPFQRLLRGELLRGGHRILVLGISLVIGVSALVTISSFSARVEQAIHNRGAELLGGHLRISAQRSLATWVEQLPERLRPALEHYEFRTMAIAGDEMRLVELKIVGDSYPLVGELLVQDQGARGTPSPGSVYVEPALLEQLQIQPGDTLSIGYAALRVAGVITREPDRVAGVFSIGPRVLMNQADLNETGLLQPGSRYRQSLLYDANGRDIRALAEELQPILPSWATLETASGGLETTRDLMRQTGDFLHMIALTGLILASAAAAIAIHSLVEQRTRAVATLKALGATRQEIITLYLLLVLVVSLVAGVLASATGFVIQQLLPALLREFLPDELPPAGAGHFVRGVAVSMVLCLVFAYLPFRQLAATPPVRVFQQVALSPGKSAVLVSLSLTLGVIGGLFYWITGNGMLVLWSTLGLALVLVGFWLGQALVFSLLRRFGSTGSLAFRYALRNLILSGNQSRFAIAALSLGIVSLLVPLLVQSDLVQHWGRKVPEGAPNRFLIDIQPHQRDEVAELLAGQGAREVEIWPMVRARMTHVDGVPVPNITTDNQRARRYLERENNLSWRAEPPPDMSLREGTWWDPDTDRNEISVEREWAESLGLGLGDTLGFSVEGRSFSGTITSIRDVEWESMKPNFFLIFSPRVLRDMPATWVTSYRADGEDATRIRKSLINRFPNVTVINLDQIVVRMQDIISRVSQAVGYLSGFTLLAGLTVLMAVVIANRQTVRRETALLRMIGATEEQVNAIFSWHFALLGGLSACLGIAAATLAGQWIALRFLQIAYRPDPTVLLVVLITSALLVLLVGRSGTRGALKTAPLRALRGLE